jgi:hypothetical protein
VDAIGTHRSASVRANLKVEDEVERLKASEEKIETESG